MHISGLKFASLLSCDQLTLARTQACEPTMPVPGPPSLVSFFDLCSWECWTSSLIPQVFLHPASTGAAAPPLDQSVTHTRFLTLSQKMRLEAPALVGLQSPMPTGPAAGEEEEASWKR